MYGGLEVKISSTNHLYTNIDYTNHSKRKKNKKKNNITFYKPKQNCRNQNTITKKRNEIKRKQFRKQQSFSEIKMKR